MGICQVKMNLNSMDSICGLLLITAENNFHLFPLIPLVCLKDKQRACLQKCTYNGCQWENTAWEYTLKIYN